MRYMVLWGRLLFSVLFLVNGASHFLAYERTVAFAAGQGVALPGLVTAVSGLMLMAGGAMVLFNRSARHGAVMLAMVLLASACCVHDFWAEASAATYQIELQLFLRNVALAGACLLLAAQPASALRFRRQPPPSLSIRLAHTAERTVPRV